MIKIRYFFIITFLALAIIVNAQEGTFSKVFSANSYDEGIAAFRMPNKTYRIIANTGAWGWGSNNIWYIALDTNANFAWHKTLGYGGIDIANAATMDSQGNIYIVGSSTSQSANSYQMLYIALDSSGATITKKYYGGVDWDFGNGISLLNDTTLALVGESYSYAQKQSDAWIQKIKLNGDLVFSTTIGGDKKEAFYAVEEDNIGNLLAVGNSQSFGNGSYDAILYHFNNVGDSVSRIINKDTTDACFLDVKIAADSSYYTVGYQRDTTDSYQDFLIHKYSKNNLKLWNGVSTRHGKEARYNALELFGNDIFAFGKNTEFGGEGDNLYCNHLNGDIGYWVASFGVGDVGDESIYSVNIDTSNTNTFYLLTGTTTSYDMLHSGVYFIRMNSNMDFDETVVVDMPSSISTINNLDVSINIFPNPVMNILSLNRVEAILNNDINIKVYDVLGKCIYKNKWNKNSGISFSIDASKWASGTYNIITEMDNNSSSQLIIKN